MSYILDALNKSEQERKNRQAPSLETVHSHVAQPAHSPRRWIIALALLLILNAGLLAFWLLNRSSTTEPLIAKTPPAPVAANPPAPASPQSNPAPPTRTASAAVAASHTPLNVAQTRGDQLITPADARPGDIAPTYAPSANASDSRASDNGSLNSDSLNPGSINKNPSQNSATGEPSDSGADAENPQKIDDLPVSVQQKIPNLRFSSHIYSNDAKYRMVNINGKMLHEGDFVAQGIRLVRITEEGVVLSYQGYTFEVSVLHGWSFD